MNKPTDYPLEPNSADSNTDISTSDMTYALLRDRVSEEKPITDEMINVARAKLDSAHVYSSQPETKPLKSKLGSIRERFKPS